MLDWMKSVTLEMLPEPHRKIADVIGIDAAVKLCAMFGGECLYVPMMETVRLEARRNLIREEFAQGIKPKVLARRYGLSERTVQRYIQEKRHP